MFSGGKASSYEFDEFRLDADKLMLYRGGDELPIRPKVVQTLLVLVRHSGEILSKDELIREVWNDTIVEESNLSQHLYQLRKILGSTPDGRPYIETLRRRGYRFNGEVEEAVEAPVAEMRSPAARRPASEGAGTEVRAAGNVLRLVERRPETSEGSAAVGATAANRPLGGSANQSTWRRKWLIPALAIPAIAAAWTMIVTGYAPWSEPVRPEAAERSVTRITNGVKPEDAAISPNGNFLVYHEAEGSASRMYFQQVGQAGRIEIDSITDGAYAGKTFSPDGREVYFVVADDKGQRRTLYRKSVTGGPRIKILEDVQTPISFLPGGNRFVFRRADAANDRSAIMIGDPNGLERILAERNGAASLTGTPAASPDGKAVVAGICGSPDSCVLARFETETGKAEPLSDERWANMYRIMFAPEGNWLALIGTRAGDGITLRDQVYRVTFPEGTSRRVSTDGNRHKITSLGVTGDGSIFAVPFNRSSQIWSMNAAEGSGSLRQITSGTADGRAGLGILPDGRIIYTARTGESANIWSISDADLVPQQVTAEPGGVEEVRIDPAGKFLIYSAVRESDPHLFRYDLEGGDGPKQLTFGKSKNVDSAISADGHWIVFDSTVFERGRYTQTLWKMPASGGEPRRLNETQCFAPTISPDGSQIACIGNAWSVVSKEVIILDFDSGAIVERHPLPAHSVVNFGAGWTRDGKGLIYIMNERGVSNLWALRRDGSPARRLTDLTSGEIHRYAFSPDGSTIFLARGYPEQDAVLFKNFR